MFFTKASTKQAKLKLGIYGDTGSGKTYTALNVATKLGKVALVDTEHSSDFYAARFDFDVIHTRSLKTLIDILNSKELGKYDVLVVDSITHFWEDAQESYIKALENSPKPKDRERAKAGQIEFQDWRHIKRPYKHMVARLLALDMHVIFCGRQASEYEMKAGQLSQVGVRMKAESETPYEPAVLVHMQLKNGKNVAIVEKDRSNTIMGKEFEYPTFAMVKPILQKLGKKHDVSEGDDGESAELYNQSVKEEAKASNSKDPTFKSAPSAKKIETIAALDPLIDQIAKETDSDIDTVRSELLQEWYNVDTLDALKLSQCREFYLKLKDKLMSVQQEV